MSAEAATPAYRTAYRATRGVAPYRYVPNRYAPTARATAFRGRVQPTPTVFYAAKPLVTKPLVNARAAWHAGYRRPAAAGLWRQRGFHPVARQAAVAPQRATTRAASTAGTFNASSYLNPFADNDATGSEPLRTRSPRVLRAAGTYGGVQTGNASYYGGGGKTANGGRVGAATCAHRTLPFGTHVLVTNLANAHTALLTVNDRGPFVGGRIIDVSTGAAATLGMLHSGTAPVRVQVVGGPG